MSTATKRESTKRRLVQGCFVLSCFRGLVLAALCCSACAPCADEASRRPGAPAADAADIVADATSACRERVDAHRRNRRERVGRRPAPPRPAAGRSRAARVRAARSGRAVRPADLHLCRRAATTPRCCCRATTGCSNTVRADKVLEAIAGVPLDAAGLRTTLTGCAVAPDVERARAVGDDWRVVPDGDGSSSICTASRRRPGGSSQPCTVAPSPVRATRWSWRAEYRDFQNGLPRSIRFASSDREALRSAAGAVAGRAERDARRRGVPRRRFRATPSRSRSRSCRRRPLAASMSSTQARGRKCDPCGLAPSRRSI